MTVDSNIYLAIIALATLGNGYINYRNKQSTLKEKEAQRLRDEAKQKATEERDRILAEATKQVADKAAEVATKVVEVAVATKEVKDHLDQSNANTDEKLDCLKEVTDKTHTIVNNQKTIMLESFARQCGLTLSVTKSLSNKDPKDKDLKEAVVIAQTIYDKAVKDAKDNEAMSA